MDVAKEENRGKSGSDLRGRLGEAEFKQGSLALQPSPAAAFPAVKRGKTDDSPGNSRKASGIRWCSDTPGRKILYE